MVGCMNRILLSAVCAGALVSANLAVAQQAPDSQAVATVKVKKKAAAGDPSGALVSVPLAASPLLIALAKKHHGNKGHHDHPKSDDGAGCHRHETGGCEHDGDGDSDNGGQGEHDRGKGHGDGDGGGSNGGHGDRP